MFRQGRIEQASAEAPLARTVPSIVGEKMRQRIPIEQVVFIMGCLFLLAFVLVRVLRKLLQNRAGARPFANLDERKLSNIYLRSIRKGLRPRDLVRVYSQMDMSLILSILSFARIPSDVLFPRMNNLRTGVAIEGYNDSIVRVLYPDYPRAKDLVQDYIAKRKRSGAIPMGTRFLNLAEFFVAGIFVNPRLPTPEIFGHIAGRHRRSLARSEKIRASVHPPRKIGRPRR